MKVGERKETAMGAKRIQNLADDHNIQPHQQLLHEAPPFGRVPVIA